MSTANLNELKKKSINKHNVKIFAVMLQSLGFILSIHLNLTGNICKGAINSSSVKKKTATKAASTLISTATTGFTHSVASKFCHHPTTAKPSSC